MASLIKTGFDDTTVQDLKDKSDRLANLQLLLGAINNEKRKKMPLEWVKEAFPKEDLREYYVQQHMLFGLSDDLKDFPEFYEKRRKALKDRIGKLLGVQAEEKADSASCLRLPMRRALHFRRSMTL